MRHERRPRALEAGLEREADRHAAADRDQQEQRRPALAGELQIDRDRQRDQRQHDDAAERGQIAHRLFEPRRAARVRGVGRVAKQQQEVAIDLLQLAFVHLLGDAEEQPDARPHHDQDARSRLSFGQATASQARHAESSAGAREPARQAATSAGRLGSLSVTIGAMVGARGPAVDAARRERD